MQLAAFFLFQTRLICFGGKNLNTPAQQLSRCPAENSDENPGV